MISAVECRQHAVEYHQMSERAPSLRVRDILIDMLLRQAMAPIQ